MRERRTSRLDPAEADRLMAGDPGGADHRGLAVLLDAAKAPASPRELAGERAAVAAFVAAYRDAERTSPAGGRRARISLPARAAVVKVAAGLAVLAGGGVALAAETGHLPAGAQHQAHRLFSAVGVPAPAPRTSSAHPAHRTSATPSPTVSARPAPGSSATSGPAAAPPGVRGLCKAWAAQQEPHGKAMKAASRKALAAAAGGADRVADFCAAQLGTPSTTPAPGAKPGHTGKPTVPPGQDKDKTKNKDKKDKTPGPKT
ncbi:hypothetical protein AB0J80_20285 [Actinoplanes sp. NPDC049548]|uniref:hypothetical protein n=1 Tax=Actinoplanes sp. NPDC049548 TaxID=3155152 RepID=UPI003433FBA0